MRLFLIWYQILMDNATDDCHRIYASLIPRLSPQDFLEPEVNGSGKPSFCCLCFLITSFKRCADMIQPVEVLPILPPQAGDPHPDDLSKWLLEALLNFTVSEVRIEETNIALAEFSRERRVAGAQGGVVERRHVRVQLHLPLRQV